MRVLFVCTANICRSAMAAEYARHRATREGLSHLVVESAGLLGIEGARASDDAVRVLREAGLDLSAHRSRGLTGGGLRIADLVVVMTLAHLQEIQHRFPGNESRLRMLRAFDRGSEPEGGPLDLDDPISRPIDFYRMTFDRIRLCVDHLILHLKHAA